MSVLKTLVKEVIKENYLKNLTFLQLRK